MLAIGFHKLAGEPKSMQNIVPTRKCILLQKNWVKLDFKNISGLYIQIPFYFCSLLCKYPISNQMVFSVESHSVTANFMNWSMSFMHWFFFLPHTYAYVSWPKPTLPVWYYLSPTQIIQINTNLDFIGISLDLKKEKKQTKNNPQFPVPFKEIWVDSSDFRIGRPKLIIARSYFRCKDKVIQIVVTSLLSSETCIFLCVCDGGGELKNG